MHLLSETATDFREQKCEKPQNVSCEGLGPSSPPQFEAPFPECLSGTLFWISPLPVLPSESPLLSFGPLGAVNMPTALKRGKEMVKYGGGGGRGTVTN